MSNSMTQVKFTIDSEIAAKFKARCVSEGVSMASVVSQFMKTSQPTKCVRVKTDTRQLRKKAVQEAISFLVDLLQKESDYRDNIPEQFQARHETADEACEQLSQAISCLESAF